MVTEIKGIEQGRAIFAYKCACAGAGRDIRKGKEIKGIYYKDENYNSYVKRLPMMIKTNGLGAALAFVHSKREKKEKEKNAYDLLYLHIKEWLIMDKKRLLTIEEDDDLVEKIISLNSTQYRAVTIEVLGFLKWLKRFSDGLATEDIDKTAMNDNENDRGEPVNEGNGSFNEKKEV